MSGSRTPKRFGPHKMGEKTQAKRFKGGFMRGRRSKRS